MTEWLVLLTPLALLPVVLLFGFVGCAVEGSGLAQEIAFRYGPGLDTLPVEKLRIAITILNPESIGSGNETIMPPSPLGDTLRVGVAPFALVELTDASARCQCEIWLDKTTTEPTSTVSTEAAYKGFNFPQFELLSALDPGLKDFALQVKGFDVS